MEQEAWLEQYDIALEAATRKLLSLGNFHYWFQKQWAWEELDAISQEEMVEITSHIVHAFLDLAPRGSLLAHAPSLASDKQES